MILKTIIGPSISKEKYEVSEDLIEKFASLKVDNYYEKIGDSYYLDLWTINKRFIRAGWYFKRKY